MGRTRQPNRTACVGCDRQATRHIALVAYPDAQILDVIGPLEVFSSAARWLGERGRTTPAYTVEVLATRSGPLRMSSGIELVAARATASVRRGIDTLLVAGGLGTQAAMQDRALLAWLRHVRPRVRRFGSVCSGTFILAEAGLLDGRRVTTHWQWCAPLAERYPQLTVDPDPIFVRDGDVYTSAGVTAGMDLALALVEEDHGRDVALQVARGLVLFLRRPGGQSQFSAQLAVQSADREPIRELQSWIADHLEADLSVPALAARVAMSPRNFARVFTQQVGVTPARFVETLRIEAARRRLEESTHGVDLVAAQCGFGSAEAMRLAFQRRLRVAPTAYRHRFAQLH
ncbi:MAG TPA: GlxA family transcriptional regulator [Candidatus Binatia bacterium]|nr:GlxA family transcriptional regulator [Candidatus Binatia bacterium]